MQKLQLADPFLLSAAIGGPCNYAGQGANSGQWIAASGGWGVECRPKPKTKSTASRSGVTMLRDISELYITVPTQDGDTMRVREDAFDHLPDSAYEAIMDIVEPYNAPQMNGLFSKWRERKKEKKDQRNERKIDKIQARAEGRTATAKAGGGIGGILKSVASSIFGKGDEGEAATPEGRGFSLDVTGGTPPKPFYKKPEIMIPLAIVAAGGIYLMTRKKKRRK